MSTFTSWSIRSSGNDRLLPRTEGMTQKEHRLPHPSCTFRLGRVRSFTASKTGAARSSVWAKMSETEMRFSGVSSQLAESEASRTNDGDNSGAPPSCDGASSFPDLEETSSAHGRYFMLRGASPDSSWLCEFPMTW